MECLLLSRLLHVLIVFFILQYPQVFGSSNSSLTPLCHPEERSALLRLKTSFSISATSSRDCGDSHYSNISSWNKSSKNCCEWDGIRCDAATGHVIGLDLQCSRLKGIISSNNSLFSLRHLQTLRLSYNDFRGSSFAPEFGQFRNLTSLDMSYSNFSGEIPLEIARLAKLSSFSLARYPGDEKIGIGAFVFRALARNLTDLTELYLKNVDMSTVSVASMKNLSSSMRALFMEHCELQGELPDAFLRFPELYYLHLTGNKLHGRIPSSIFQIENLHFLELFSNNFNGDLDFSFKTLMNHSYDLELSSSNISEFVNFPKLSKNLAILDLSQNRIEGIVPKWFMELGKDSLLYLNLSHNFLTHIEPILWNNLETLDLSSNLFSGPLPISESTITPLKKYFLLLRNQFVGEIPYHFCNMTSLTVLDLSYNDLSGKIPSCITSFRSSLSVLDLRMNNLHGSIPSNFTKENSLRTLNLNGNQLHGSLDRSLLNCELLQVLDIGGNNISGSFPQWLESLPYLEVLILRGNKFYGPIGDPMMPFSFQKLRIFDISNNEITGPLPQKYFENFVAMMDMDTDPYNPNPWYMGDEYYHDSVVVVKRGVELELKKILIIFTTIDLSSNNFEGEIPISIGKLKSLKGLRISHNKLVGLIPLSLANLSNLEWLDLSSNGLYGEIPNKLAEDLTQLSFLNLSYNSLVGQIPRGNQFNTFENDSYIGNLGLCGSPLTETCSDEKAQPSPMEREDEGFDLKIVALIGYGCGMVFGVSMGYVIIPDTTIHRIVNIRSIKKMARKVRIVAGRRN